MGGAQATEALRITSSELVTFGVMDTVIEEPLGGAHADPMGAFPAIKAAIMNIYNNKYAVLPPSASFSTCLNTLPISTGLSWPIHSHADPLFVTFWGPLVNYIYLKGVWHVSRQVLS